MNQIELLRKLVIFFPVSFLLLFWSVNSPQAWAILMGIWMILWWVFEILPLGITALIPLVFIPLVGISSLKEVTPSYSEPVIFLFLGGFMLARALEKTGLSERIALTILKFTGKSDKGIVAGFIIATGGLSMWISNTATTIMMVPIALSVLSFLERKVSDPESKQGMRNFGVVIFLSIAYAANIGGTATPIGTPPNVVFVGYLDELFQRRIDFWRWMLVMTPIAAILLFFQFHLLNRVFRFKISIPNDFRKFVSDELSALGKISAAQRVTLACFGLTCFLWVFKGLVTAVIPGLILSDTSIAIFGGILLFLIPARLKDRHGVLEFKDIALLPWNIVLLFGGGMALASTLEKVGILQSMVDQFSTIHFSSTYLLIGGLAATVLFLTEVMSNVAVCVVLIPILMSLGKAQGIDPILIALPATICSSFAFSFPISTPPNAIVFGTGKIAMPDMIRAGIVANLLGWVVLMTVGWLLIPFLI